MPQTAAIIIGSDHAGFPMKEYIKSELKRLGFVYSDVGTNSTEPVDYPLYAARVARAVSNGRHERGIAICGAGIGASITANRFRGVRAGLCLTEEMARLSRAHNNANVLVLGGRITPMETAGRILSIWLETPFEGGRHERRIKEIDEVAHRDGD
jgi:ribose 5-phosphate isomerase B